MPATLAPVHPLAERLAALDAPAVQAAAAGATLHALLGETVVRAAGPDAPAFLQSQFSNDVGLLGPDNAQWTAYCTPQGRTLAIPLAWKSRDALLLALPVDLAAGLVARLRRYVLRARVELSETAGQFVLLGAGGRDAGAAIRSVFGAVPAHDLHRLDARSGESVIRLRYGLFVVVAPAERAAATWDALAAHCTPAAESGWHSHLIRARIPRLTAAVQDQFVPQMLGLEELGAISFDKGCYPGQEIVARAHYLGQVKRRLLALHASHGPLLPGQSLLGTGGGSAGTVLDAAPSPAGGWDALAVVPSEAADDPGLHADGSDGVLTPLP